VDSNATSLEILRAQLTCLSAQVMQANSGEQALGYLRNNTPIVFDGAFIDSNMPDITAESLVKQIHEIHPGLRVILMTSMAYSGDDDHINQMVILEQLKVMGLSADVCCNGLEAINTLTKTPTLYDIILMDCQMPEMDGYETTRQIRAGVVDRYTDVTM
jgi:CheY-like chemotaxis protein